LKKSWISPKDNQDSKVTKVNMLKRVKNAMDLPTLVYQCEQTIKFGLSSIPELKATN